MPVYYRERLPVRPAETEWREGRSAAAAAECRLGGDQILVTAMVAQLDVTVFESLEDRIR